MSETRCGTSLCGLRRVRIEDSLEFLGLRRPEEKEVEQTRELELLCSKLLPLPLLQCRLPRQSLLQQPQLLLEKHCAALPGEVGVMPSIAEMTRRR